MAGVQILYVKEVPSVDGRVNDSTQYVQVARVFIIIGVGGELSWLRFQSWKVDLGLWAGCVAPFRKELPRRLARSVSCRSSLMQIRLENGYSRSIPSAFSYD